MTEPAEPSGDPTPGGQTSSPPAGRSRPPAVQWALLFALVLIPIAAVVWIAAPPAVCGCTPLPTHGLPASPVEGVVIAVDSAGLGQVRGFTIRPTDVGFAFQLRLGPLENAGEFPASHLPEHLATSGAIRAWYRLEAGIPVVYRLEDAGPGSS